MPISRSQIQVGGIGSTWAERLVLFFFLEFAYDGLLRPFGAFFDILFVEVASRHGRRFGTSEHPKMLEASVS
jgi:hypothetical protein